MLYLDIPTADDYAALAAFRGDMAVSIALPTTPVTESADADRIQVKNLAKEAVDQLTAAGADKRRLLDLIEEFDDLIEDDIFWAYQARGLVIYATPDNLRSFRVPNALQPVVKVSDRFHLKPLLRSTTFCDAGYVLALADGGVRLIEVSKDLPAIELNVPGLPTDAASAAGKRSISTRSYSGRIGGGEGKKVRLRQYARQIDTSVRAILAGRQEPLILASVDALDTIYRSVNSYPHLLEQGLRGNPERQSPAELAHAARALLDEVYWARIAEWRARYHQRSNEDRATTDLQRAARAATAGAVASLLVDMDQVIHGTVDDTDGQVTLAKEASAETYGVADEVARRTLGTGGEVFSVRAEDMPDPGKPVAAILRYPI